MPINQMVEAHRRVRGTRRELSADDDELVLVVAQARAGVSGAWETLVGRFGGLGCGNRQTVSVKRR